MEQRLERASNYYTVITLMVFGCLFFGTACMQMNAATAFAVEDPVLRAHLGDLDAEAFTVNMPDDILEWVDSTLVGGAFEDAQCGNGQCESPQEYPGFGRFGCEDDCGKYKKTSRIMVDFGTIDRASAALGWDWSKVPKREKPIFTYNIWSETMGDWLFEQALVANGTKVMVDVPDGDFKIHLFQQTKMSPFITDSMVAEKLRLSPADYPTRYASRPPPSLPRMCMYLYMYMHMHMHMHMYLYMYLYVYLYKYMHTYMYTVSICVCVYVCTSVRGFSVSHVHVCMYVHQCAATLSCSAGSSFLAAHLCLPAAPAASSSAAAAAAHAHGTTHSDPAITDYHFGDVGEMVASAAVLMAQLDEYCWGGNMDWSGAGDTSKLDFSCMLEPETHKLLKVLSSYGVEGTVTMSEKGKKAPTVRLRVRACARAVGTMQACARAQRMCA